MTKYILIGIVSEHFFDFKRGNNNKKKRRIDAAFFCCMQFFILGQFIAGCTVNFIPLGTGEGNIGSPADIL